MAAAVQDPYAILGVSRDAVNAEIRQAFRALALEFHPDRNPAPAAVERFKDITAAHELLSDPVRRKRFDATGSAGPVVIPSRKDHYHVEGRVFVGEVADLYRARRQSTGDLVCLKVARAPGDNDLLESEARTLLDIYPPAQKDEKHYRYLPRLIESFKLDDGARRQVNVLPWLGEFRSLEEVRAAYPQGVAMEHGVWIFNRMLEALDFLHLAKGMAHGALVPAHVLVRPEDHAAKLVGWSCAVKAGERVRAISPRYRALYAPEVLDKEPVTWATDLYMAAKCVIYVLGGDCADDVLPPSVPGYFASFLRGCVLRNPRRRPQNAWTLHEELKEHLAKHYGPRKFVPFHMPDRADHKETP